MEYETIISIRYDRETNEVFLKETKSDTSNLVNQKLSTGDSWTIRLDPAGTDITRGYEPSQFEPILSFFGEKEIKKAYNWKSSGEEQMVEGVTLKCQFIGRSWSSTRIDVGEVRNDAVLARYRIGIKNIDGDKYVWSDLVRQ